MQYIKLARSITDLEYPFHLPAGVVKRLSVQLKMEAACVCVCARFGRCMQTAAYIDTHTHTTTHGVRVSGV